MDARDFNNIETRTVIKLFFLQGKAQKEIHAILTETLAFFLPGRVKYLSAPGILNSIVTEKVLFSLYRIGCLMLLRKISTLCSENHA
jgi:hypothetical protein